MLIGKLHPGLLKFRVFKIKSKQYETVESAKSIDGKIDQITTDRKSPNRRVTRHYKDAVTAINKRKEREKRLAESELFLARIFDKANRD